MDIEPPPSEPLPRAAPLRLLLVDDDEVDRMAVRRALAQSGLEAEIEEAGDVDAGLEALGARPFDCVLLDYRMPRRDGLDFLLEARAAGRQVPVVMMTGQGDEHVAVEAMKAGAADYIPKSALGPQRLAQGVRHATRLHQAEAAARSAQEALRARIEFEEQLIGIVSHDLRNPLNAITLSARALMRRDDIDPVVAKGLSRILASGERAARLIRDLLDFTRARMGQGIPIERRAVDLHEIAAQVVDEVRQAHPRREVRHEASGDGSGDWDPDRLAQLITNLAVNAVSYSPPDSVVHVGTTGRPDSVAIEIRNAGEPIPEHLLPVLFEPMQRNTGTQSASSGGIGLGLFIVAQLARAHAGRVEIRSDRQAGTAVTVELPRRS